MLLHINDADKDIEKISTTTCHSIFFFTNNMSSMRHMLMRVKILGAQPKIQGVSLSEY